uniref:Uncharacterized protein n=1 Tax=Rhizophagus irregularis (strain DAOM 181602 / DAOM 197198 / MUCL 43194) TaxID=747089 RepID=U9U8X0_RHIID
MFNKVIDCSYNSNGLFKDTYFQRRKEPESERDESNKDLSVQHTMKSDEKRQGE